MTALKQAQSKYEQQNRIIKKVSLHKVNDAQILEFLSDKEFSTYIKLLIIEDMSKNQGNPQKVIERNPQTVDWVDAEETENVTLVIESTQV